MGFLSCPPLFTKKPSKSWISGLPTLFWGALAHNLGTKSGIFLLLLSSLLVACAPNATPNLLEIESLGPSTLEFGSEIRIRGTGFPENRPGTLLLSGTAYAPARRPREVHWELPLQASSRGEVAIRLSAREINEQLQGADHATFRGDASLEFAPLLKGRPVLRGQKKNLVLDLFASGDPDTKDTQAFLLFLGLELGDGLHVSQLSAGGRAAKAGLKKGDRLVTLDNVRLDSAQDFLPQAAARSSIIEYSREGHRGSALASIDRGDFQVLDAGVAARALAVIGGIVLALLWTARPSRFLLWLFGAKSKFRKARAVWLCGVGQRWQFLAYPIFLTVVIGYWWLLSGLSPLEVEVEFLLCLSLGALLLLVSSFLTGGARSTARSFSLLGALSGAFLRLLLMIPILIAALSRASETGSLRLAEITNEQGAWPQDWGLFASPWTFVLGVSFLVCLLPLSGRRPPLEGHPGNMGPSLVWSRTCEWGGVLLFAGLWVLIFGGADLGSAPLSFLSGAILSAKLAFVAHLVSWVRARSGQLRLGEAWGLFGWANLFASLLAAVLSFASTTSGFSEDHTELLALFAVALALSSALLLFISSQRSWAHMGRRIDPWI